MLFGHFRSVPSNTTEADPDKQTLQIIKGVLSGWVIFFDPEAADQLHVRVEYHGFKILPYGELAALVGFLEPVRIPDSIKIDKDPAELRIIAWNDDDSYPHEYYVHSVIMPHKPVTPSVDEDEGLLERFFEWIGG